MFFLSFLFCLGLGWVFLCVKVTGCRRKLTKRPSDRRGGDFLHPLGRFLGSICLPQAQGSRSPPTPPHRLGGTSTPRRWGNAMTLLARWAHSSSPATSAGIWVSDGDQPMAKLPGDRMDQDQAPPHPQQLARQLTGFRRNTWTSEDPPLQPGKGRFLRASPPVSDRPSHIVTSYGSFQTQSRRSLMELLG